jgi:hypothetical protein
MIILITTRGNGRTLDSLPNRTFGVPTPEVRITHYERLFRSWRVPRATYIFADLERLRPWELRVASDLYRSMRAAGLRCLNDPAKAMARVELLIALHRAGINPFSAMRADTAPRPDRFPVFLRFEDDHVKADPMLYASQEELDAALHRLRHEGTPLRGLIVVEQASEPYSDGLWAKWGTWRIGDRVIDEHIAVDDTWLVKIGDHAKITDAVCADEHDAVSSQRFAAAVGPAFEIGGIEFGRADHAVVGGKSVIYEINTNPSLRRFVADRRPLRKETQLIARSRIAEALQAIDTEGGGRLAVPATPIRRPIRWWVPGLVPPRRK